MAGERVSEAGVVVMAVLLKMKKIDIQTLKDAYEGE